MITLITATGYIMGAASIIAGIKMLWDYKTIIKHWVKIKGKITKLEKRFGTEIGESYWPHYEYTLNNITHTGIGKTGSEPPEYKLDQSIIIYVNPNNVNESEIYDFRFRLLPWGLLVLGILFFAFSAYHSV